MQAAAVNGGGGDVQKPQQQQHQQPVVLGAPSPPAAAVVPSHWVAMPFAPPPGAAAMVMPAPHQMAPAPPQFAPTHFVPFHAVAPPPPPPRAVPVPAIALGSPAPHQAGQEENKTVWVGDLHYWMDENYLHSCFGYTGEVVAIKVIRNKQTGQSEGYGFVEFYSHAAAEKVLEGFSGHIMPNTDQHFRLNWASFSMGDRRSDVASDHSIFVGDLASDVNDATLLETFSSRYSSVKGAKVVIDANTGRSKGYGFVRFGDDSEKTHAMTEMNGMYCSSRPMRIGPATPRKSSGSVASFSVIISTNFHTYFFAPVFFHKSFYLCSTSGSNGSSARSDGGDLTNTTVFVGGLDPNVSEEDLRQTFSQYGEISSVKIPVGKQCGFVQFAQRKNAEDALQGLNGSTIGKQTVRLSWGRNPANKQFRGDNGNQWNNGMYYTASPFYNGYGYPAAQFPDPGMYAAPAYGAYPFYGNQQQVS
ncbi:Polyadenylate-binding protein RBP47 [Dichanthelium oligosanthes]|uniref:Polyadenylate-binding protein RBP47 n=1 Tax=Dichanthelium oligosanthes TaxID=888268 RepID=A0A1E5W6I7_9POAL|nr:Polyadenylate-binding protein RBP47 [Dichanthelium oligosanthes]